MPPRTLITNIMEFAYADQEEWERAVHEFEGSLHEDPSPDEIDQFELEYVFSRKHSAYKKTFVRLFVECFEELYGKEYARDILYLEKNFSSYFEVIKSKKECLIVEDLLMGDTFEVTPPEVDYVPQQGDIIYSTVFPWKDTYFFYGPLALYDEEEAKEAVKNFTFVARDCSENATQSFLEYFGSDVVIFKDYKELENKLNQFLKWFFKNKTPPGVLTEEEKENFTPVTFEEIRGEKEIGLVINYFMGQMVMPNYGYAQKLFSGEWEKVPDYSTMVKKVLYEDEIPSYFIREMIEDNPESSVALYSQFFPKVKTKEDLLNLFAKFRRDWGRKPRRNGFFFEELLHG
jgi:hypothetical protein